MKMDEGVLYEIYRDLMPVIHRLLYKGALVQLIKKAVPNPDSGKGQGADPLDITVELVSVPVTDRTLRIKIFEKAVDDAFPIAQGLDGPVELRYWVYARCIDLAAILFCKSKPEYMPLPSPYAFAGPGKHGLECARSLRKKKKYASYRPEALDTFFNSLGSVEIHILLARYWLRLSPEQIAAEISQSVEEVMRILNEINRKLLISVEPE